jgi:hypothetical protein
MWYMVYSGRYMNGYAESRDGLTWQKPRLGQCAFRGSKENNLVLSDESSTALALTLSIVKRPGLFHISKRFAAFFMSLEPKPLHPGLAFSLDGVRWKISPQGPEGLQSGDEMRVFFDPYQRRYIATCKCAKPRRGRAVRIATSRHGVAWENLASGDPVVYSLETGKRANQIYNMPVFAYQGYYLGLPNIYHAGWPDHDPPVKDGELAEGEKDTPTSGEIEIAWSRDLIAWQRPPGAGQCPLIELGPAGAFDSGMVMGVANAPVVMGDELWFYYGGWDGPHRSTKRNAAIGLAALRLDGFASVQAGEDEGWLITQPESFSKPAVVINAKTRPGGEIVAELLDGNGRPWPGFDRASCVPFKADSVRHVLAWRRAKGSDLPAGVRLKIRFFLRLAELYSYVPG